jgi:hypothetical protein
LLGASNLARGIATVVEAARLIYGTPLDVMAAYGHGRSYGMTSCVLGRSLPGIVDCGLWQDLAARPRVPTVGLVTDIGNDILYGARTEEIAHWLEQCLDRLAANSERIIVTELPLAGLASLAPWRYRLVRTLLFPRSRLSCADALTCAHELNARVLELAARYAAAVCTPSRDWYGWDLIHIKARCGPTAWGQILASWCADHAPQPARGSWRQWWMLARQRPLYRRMFGIEQRRTQPSCVLRAGVAISLY